MSTLSPNIFWPIVFGILAATGAAFVKIWRLTNNLHAAPRLLLRSTIFSFVVAPGLIGSNHGGAILPFSLYFYPLEGIPGWHRYYFYSVGITWIVISAALVINEFIPRPCKKCNGPISKRTKEMFCEECREG